MGVTREDGTWYSEAACVRRDVRTTAYAGGPASCTWKRRGLVTVTLPTADTFVLNPALFLQAVAEYMDQKV